MTFDASEQQKRELETALSEMTAARERAERANRQLTDFLRLVTHELRSPLGAIHLQLELLTRGLKDALRPEQSDLVVRITRSSSRLMELAELLLQFGAVEGNRVLTELDLDMVAGQIVEELRETSDATSIRLDRSADGAVIASDPELVRSIIANLCQCVIGRSRGREIVVAVNRHATATPRVSVTDAGLDSPMADEKSAFQPIEPLESAHHELGPDVRLRLSLVTRIAAALGAELVLESAQGHAVRFSVRFPSRAPS